MRAKAEREQEVSAGADFEAENGVCWVGLWSEDGEVTIGVAALNATRAWEARDAAALSADGHASVEAEEDGSALAPDFGPPRTVGAYASLSLGQSGGGLGVRSSSRWTSWALRWWRNWLRRRVGLLGGGDALGREEAGQAALPVRVLAFLGLRRAGVAQ